MLYSHSICVLKHLHLSNGWYHPIKCCCSSSLCALYYRWSHYPQSESVCRYLIYFKSWGSINVLSMFWMIFWQYFPCFHETLSLKNEMHKEIWWVSSKIFKSKYWLKKEDRLGVKISLHVIRSSLQVSARSSALSPPKSHPSLPVTVSRSVMVTDFREIVF
jgi:hypothetical protein